jgi:hypothetical protein
MNNEGKVTIPLQDYLDLKDDKTEIKNEIERLKNLLESSDRFVKLSVNQKPHRITNRTLFEGYSLPFYQSISLTDAEKEFNSHVESLDILIQKQRLEIENLHREQSIVYDRNESLKRKIKALESRSFWKRLWNVK